ncbi:MAG: hypothetical protein ACWGNK_09570 [Desulfobacterales bacterium]
MIRITIHIAETICSVAQHYPPRLTLESRAPLTIRQIARNIGIPVVLIVFAIVDGVKMNLDDVIDWDAKIHLFGTMAGG